MGYGDFTDLLRGAASVKVLCNKTLNIAKNQKYERYQHELASVIW